MRVPRTLRTLGLFGPLGLLRRLTGICLAYETSVLRTQESYSFVFHEKNKSLRYTAVCFLFLLLLISACAGDTPEPKGASVQVEDVKYTLLPGGARIVTGTLYNSSEARVKGAQIQISLFDGNNVRVSSMIVTITDLQPGERKPFRQPVDTDLDIKGAKVRSVLVM